eukprot:30169-Pelagococcus_subviridis.AAC.1
MSYSNSRIEYTTPTMLSILSLYTGTREYRCSRQIFWSSCRDALWSTPTTRTSGVITSRTGVSDISRTFWIISLSSLSTCPLFAAPDKTSLSSSSDTNGSAEPRMPKSENTKFTAPAHTRPSGYTKCDNVAMTGMTTRATAAACCTAIDLGAISQQTRVTSVSASVIGPTPPSPQMVSAASVATVALAMPLTVLPMRIVVRNRLMSRRKSVNGESGPSWSEISRTFHGHSVVMAVSEMAKKA